VEGLLDREQALQCQMHLESCAACRAEYTAITRLQQQLVARGQATAGVSIIGPVMQRVHAIQPNAKENSIYGKIISHDGDSG